VLSGAGEGETTPLNPQKNYPHEVAMKPIKKHVTNHVTGAKEPRKIELTLRVNKYEHELIKKRVTEKTMSRWLRNLALKSTPIAIVDPELIRQIGRIGSNLNQITKHANTDEQLDKQVLNEITAIRELMHKLINQNLEIAKRSADDDR
jgi:hypothetical protein|tara:strand:- start:168 stop:611 length:444 start_codon:yes stop_codon:yes gene_type:complete